MYSNGTGAGGLSVSPYTSTQPLLFTNSASEGGAYGRSLAGQAGLAAARDGGLFVEVTGSPPRDVAAAQGNRIRPDAEAQALSTNREVNKFANLNTAKNMEFDFSNVDFISKPGQSGITYRLPATEPYLISSLKFLGGYAKGIGKSVVGMVYEPFAMVADNVTAAYTLGRYALTGDLDVISPFSSAGKMYQSGMSKQEVVLRSAPLSSIYYQGKDAGAAISGTDYFKSGEASGALIFNVGMTGYAATNLSGIGGASNAKPNTLSNLFSSDPAILQKTARTLVQDSSGRYWLESSSGNRITPSGVYDFVTLTDGAVKVARSNSDPNLSTHLGLSKGGEVNYAGTVRFGQNEGANRGTITSWSNNSGHYQPPPSLAGNANLPLNFFVPF